MKGERSLKHAEMPWPAAAPLSQHSEKTKQETEVVFDSHCRVSTFPCAIQKAK
jgi:hypothetical protein